MIIQTKPNNLYKGELVDDDLIRPMLKCTCTFFEIVTPTLHVIPQKEGETREAVAVKKIGAHPSSGVLQGTAKVCHDTEVVRECFALN
jgi:hypothetical protein